MQRAWVDLAPDDVRNLLISLIGFRFGEHPEERLDEIRAERAEYARRFVRMARVGPGDTVLDLGSGCGFGTRAIARVAGEVIACDISPAFLAFARQECADLDNVQFRQVESRDLSGLPEASLDAAISMSVFIHLNLYDIHAYFLQLRRVLRPGARLVFDFADMDRLFSRWRARPNDAQFLEHSKYYLEDPSALPGLVQWNSARGIRGVARETGFVAPRRRGHLLSFRRSAA